MKRICISLLVILPIYMSSCYSSKPIAVETSRNNKDYKISYLFEHEGLKVYRFYDQGNYVYFTSKGETTSIVNDSTSVRTQVMETE